MSFTSAPRSSSLTVLVTLSFSLSQFSRILRLAMKGKAFGSFSARAIGNISYRAKVTYGSKHTLVQCFCDISASIVDIDAWTTRPVCDLEHTVLDTAARVANILVGLESDEALSDKVIEGLDGVGVVALFALFAGQDLSTSTKNQKERKE
jgi:hypothetical protein